MIIEGVPHFGRGAADRDWTAAVAFPVEDVVKTLPDGIAVQATIDRRADVKEVKWNGKVLEHGAWRTWTDEVGVVVRAEISEPPVKGENGLAVRYEVPFKRHAEPRKR